MNTYEYLNELAPGDLMALHLLLVRMVKYEQLSYNEAISLLSVAGLEPLEDGKWTDKEGSIYELPTTFKQHKNQ